MGYLTDFTKLLRSKKDLFICIFITLIIQIIITIVTIKFDERYNILDKRWWIILFVILITFVIILLLYTNIPYYVKLILLVIFSVCFGLILSGVVNSINDKNIITSAAISTLINFVVLFIIGLIIVYFKYDLSWMGIYLLIALLIITTISIISMFSNNSKMYYKIIGIVCIILYSLFILYDTNNILLKYKNDKNSCIMGAIDYYLDIINLFTTYIDLNN